MGFEIAQIQRDMIAHIVNGDMGIRIHVFRGSSKSFILDLYVIWRILRFPSTKVLIFSAKAENAARHIKEIRQLLGRSMLTRGWLKRLRLENKYELDFHFSKLEAAPNIKCVGIEGSVEGSRADLILSDDAETASNSRTDAARDWLIQRMNEYQNIIHPTPRWTGDTEKAENTQIIVVGTYFSPLSVYIPPATGGGHPLKGFPVFHRAALDSEDQTTFPERFTSRVLHRKRATIDEREWVLQYMLDLTRLGTLSGAVDWDTIIRKTIPLDEIHYTTMTLDPVAERIKGKRTTVETDEISFTIAGMVRGPTGKLNRLHIMKIAGSSKDSSEAFMRHIVVPALLEYKVMRIQVESNQPAAYNLMRRILIEQKVTTCGMMEPWAPTRNKHDRILAYLEPNIDGGLVSFDPEVLEDDETAHQLKALTYRGLPRHDDRIDSLAAMIQVFTPHLGIPDTTNYDTNAVYIREG